LSSFQIEQTSRVSDLDAGEWDRSVGGEGVFLQHAWLSALEYSGAVGGDTGWSPLPLLARSEGRAVGALPLYLKSHSYGEYVFDWSWAEAYHQAGLAYYPKLLAAIPFTPVTGPRFAGEPDAATALMQTVEQMQDEHRIASAHVLFPPEEEALRLQQRGWLLRHGVQFHWHNRGYRDFDDFLDVLERSKRKKIKQERRRVTEAGVTVSVKNGHQASAEDWAFFTRCYNNTYREHRSSPYLNLDFFMRIGTALPDAVRLFIAEREGVPVAASLCLADGDKLYGRYWGALEEIPCLHFELCYYAGIELAIAERLVWFEGGAQGEHKLARGFLPVRTYSAHRLLDPRFSEAIARWLQRERAAMKEYERELLEHSAYKTEA
jgi:predicted N-acyltransferase